MNLDLTPDARKIADSWLSYLQTEGRDTKTPVDRDWLCEPGHINHWMLYYFPTKFIRWEPLNDYFFHFVETRQKGLILFPGGHGKDLDCATPILTTVGWKTMGTVDVGDEVYGADGKPTRVSYVSEVFEDHQCYELTFSDGAVIVAGEDHLWRVLGCSTPTVSTRDIIKSGIDYLLPPTSKQRKPVRVTDGRSVQTRPTRCIQVEHPDHVFLVGELFTPTHNTTMLLRWPIRIWATAKSAAVIYTEKNQPTANSRGNAVLNELVTNRRLIEHYGHYKPPAEMARQWAASAFTIRQRVIEQDTPSFMAWGAGGASSLGWRCNVLLNDDPVTADHAKSAVDMKALCEWFTTISKTSPSPLPVEDERYLIKHFLIGTAWTMDDLYAKVAEDAEFDVLRLEAVLDEDLGITLSDRFRYEEPEALKLKAETDPQARQTMEDIELGKVTNLYTFKYGMEGGITAFYRRYQNKPVDPEKQKFHEAMFAGGLDKETGNEYPGCWDESHTLWNTAEAIEPHWVTAVGLDPMSSSLSKRSKRAGLVGLAADPAHPDHIYLVNIDWGKWPQESTDLERKTQMGQFVQMTHDLDARGYIESNACQLGLQGAALVEAKRRKLSISVRPHYTGSNKLDPNIGIEGMVPMIESGRLHLPAATDYDRLRAKELVSEFVLYGVYPYTDLLMAFWFAWFNLKRRLKTTYQAKTPPKEPPAYVNRLCDISIPSSMKPESIIRYLLGQGWPEEAAMQFLVDRGYPIPEKEEAA